MTLGHATHTHTHTHALDLVRDAPHSESHHSFASPMTSGLHTHACCIRMPVANHKHRRWRPRAGAVLAGSRQAQSRPSHGAASRARFFCSLSPRDSLALLACAASAKTSAVLIRWFVKQRWGWMTPARPSGYCPKTRASTLSFCRFLWPLACLLTALMATRCRALRPQCVGELGASPILPTLSTPHPRRHIHTVMNINTNDQRRRPMRRS